MSVCVRAHARARTPRTIQTMDSFAICFPLLFNAIQFVILLLLKKKAYNTCPLECVRSGVLDMCIHIHRESQLKSEAKKKQQQQNYMTYEKTYLQKKESKKERDTL